MKNKFIRKIEFRPAFDKRSSDPKKDYGIHGAELAFYLYGPRGTIQFVVSTNWQLKHVQEELDRRINLREDGKWLHLLCHPTPVDIGYHSPRRMYKSQKSVTAKCQFVNNRRCYYDGSALGAIPIYWKLVSEGHEAVWAAMENYYRSRFESK